MTPSARSKRMLEADGWLVDTVECYNAFKGRRNDLYGFLDLLAVGEGRVMGIQVTTGSNVAARIRKIQGHENYPRVVQAMRVVVHGWRKDAAGKWVCREIELTGDV